MGGGTFVPGKKAPDFSFYQEILFEKPDKSPVVFQGESLAYNAGYGGDYCIFADLHFADGTVRYAVKAKWRPGTHSWERAVMCYYPEKPVRKIVLSVLLRNSSGKALFRNISLRRGNPGPMMSYCSLLSLAPFSRTHYRLDLGFFGAKTQFSGKFTDKAGKSLAEFKSKGKIYRKEFSFAALPHALELEMTDKNMTKREKILLSTLVRKAPEGKAFAPVVWCANAMEKISPLTLPGKNPAQQKLMELAGNERESMQIVISNGKNQELKNVTCTVSDFRNESGIKFPGKINLQRIAYRPRTIPYATHPEQLPESEYWLPDPLLPMCTFSVPGRGNAGIWLTAYAPAGTLRGIYSGTVKVAAAGKVLGNIKVQIRVFGFDLPKTFSYRSAFSVMDGWLELYYPGRLPEFRRKAWDIMLDHRLNPDDITRTEMPEISDLLYARSRGMNSFNILHLVPKPKKKVLWVIWGKLSEYNEKLFREFADRLDGYIAELEKHDLKKMGYFYGFDERRKDAFDALSRTRAFVKNRWNIPLMSTSTMFQELVRHPDKKEYQTTDWYCPLTNFYNPGLAERLRKNGHQVWSYTCCGPEYPYVNFANLEFPFMNGRQIAWQVYTLKADGFLFWHVNNWAKRKPMYMSSKSCFQRWYQHDKYAMNATGDGELLYPGWNEIYPSIRLANVRDGSEDYDYLTLLRAKNPAMADKLAKQVCPSRKNGIRDYKKLLMIRRQIAEYLEKH